MADRDPRGGYVRKSPLDIQEYVLEEYQQELAEQEQRRKEEEARQQQAAIDEAKAASKRLWDEFVQENGVEVVLAPGDLARNPFRYEGQVVIVRGSFDRMIGRNVAIFTNGPYVFVADNVPSTIFSGEEIVLLAARVKGVTEQGATSLEYVGSHVCRDERCLDFSVWMN
jgi:hypothetical protein